MIKTARPRFAALLEGNAGPTLKQDGSLKFSPSLPGVPPDFAFRQFCQPRVGLSALLTG